MMMHGWIWSIAGFLLIAVLVVVLVKLSKK